MAYVIKKHENIDGTNKADMNGADPLNSPPHTHRGPFALLLCFLFTLPIVIDCHFTSYSQRYSLSSKAPMEVQSTWGSSIGNLKIKTTFSPNAIQLPSEIA